MSLKKKLVVSQLMLAVTPMVAVAAVVLFLTSNGLRKVTAATGTAFKENNDRGRDAVVEAKMSGLAQVAEHVHMMCQAQQELLQQKLDASLNVARDVLGRAGAVSFASETVPWRAINQTTKTETAVQLPKMLIGNTWLGQNSDSKTASLVVDRVTELVGAACTIFQQINDAGDMLRVCTNVRNLDGTRAVGTFIAAKNADGSANPVIGAICGGQAFRG